MIAAVLSLAAAVDPPPYTFNLDQSVRCPRDVSDAWLSGHERELRPVLPNASSDLEGVISSIPAMLDESMQVLRAPSAMIIGMQEGGVLFESYRGTARIGKQVPPTRDSGFMIASNSKVFTSVMLYQLRDRGMLPQGLDTTVAALMPGWVEPAAWGKSRRGITLRALATHSSGLPRETPPGSTEGSLLAKIGELPTLWPQFAGTAYSNLGLALLGRTLEKATGGRTWEDWVRTEIMQPLGMTRSGPCLQTAADAASIVDGVDPSAPNRPVPRHYTNSTSCAWGAPAGAVFSTPADMSLWGAFLAGTLEASSVLDPASVLELRTSATLQPDGISAVTGATFEAAWMQPTAASPAAVDGHWAFNKLGCYGGYRSAITVIPELGLSVFAAAASTCDFYGDGDGLSFPILAKLMPPLSSVLDLRMAATVLAPANAQDYVGSYACAELVAGARMEGGGYTPHTTTVAVEDGRLVMSGVPGGYPWLLLQLDSPQDAFRMLMREPSADLDGCHDKAWPGAQLCKTSCFRQMARGDSEPLFFTRDASGAVTLLASPGVGLRCAKA